jgi:SAM-dependent methyltransferase/ribosomal protein S18 acetylase RimI-like enzyme
MPDVGPDSHSTPRLDNAEPQTLRDPIQCETIEFSHVDFRDPIFDSIRVDYPDFEAWHSDISKASSSRSAFLVRWLDGSYAAIAIVKPGEGPEGPSQRGLKISTFKVSRQAEARGVADVLLSRVFERAIQLGAESVFISVPPNHNDLVRYLELRGFRRAPTDLNRGEGLYVAEIAHPGRFYSSINRLAYDLLADEYRHRSLAPGPSQESPAYLASLLTSCLPKPIRRVLELGPGSGAVLSALGMVAEQTVAVDISPKMAAVAQSRAPRALIIIADVLKVDFPEHSFDGVYAGAFLHLFPRAHAARLVRRIARWTKPGGAAFVNTSISDRFSESIEVKPDYTRRVARFRSRWTEAQFRRLLESNGLRIDDRITTNEREREKSWVGFLCRPE